MSENKNVAWHKKLQVYAPQLFFCTMLSTCVMLSCHFYDEHNIRPIVVGSIMWAVIFGLLAIVTSIGKAMKIDDDGWEFYLENTCDVCPSHERTIERLNREITNLKDTIISLKVE